MLSIYTMNPVYCMDAEEVSKTHVENHSTFLGINNIVAATWIGATGAVVATAAAPIAVKMRLLTGGSLGGLATLSIVNQVTQPQNWVTVKKRIATGFKEGTSNSLNTNFFSEI